MALSLGYSFPNPELQGNEDLKRLKANFKSVVLLIKDVGRIIHEPRNQKRQGSYVFPGASREECDPHDTLTSDHIRLLTSQPEGKCVLL